MEKRIASFKVSSLLTLFLSVFFAFSVNTRASVSGFLKDFDGVFDAWSAGIVVAVPVLER